MTKYWKAKFIGDTDRWWLVKNRRRGTFDDPKDILYIADYNCYFRGIFYGWNEQGHFAGNKWRWERMPNIEILELKLLGII